MDEPRPRTAPADLIIEDPKLQTLGQKTLYGLLTVVFWALWIYLWLPLITLLAWAFGISRFVDIMVVGQGFEALKEVIVVYFIVIAVMGGALVLWALYNRIRFSGRERRTNTTAPASSAIVARNLRQRETTVLIWQHQKNLRVSHDQAGHIERVQVVKLAPGSGSGTRNLVYSFEPKSAMGGDQHEQTESVQRDRDGSGTRDRPGDSTPFRP